MNYKGIKGFIEKNKLISPGLQLLVLNKKKDTILFNEDLFANRLDSYNSSDFKLSPNITLADPIHSRQTYEVLTHVWDKNGNGSIDTKFKINVVPSEKIKIEKTDLIYNEIYLYSDKRENAIIDNRVILNENIHFVFDGLEGLVGKNGKVSLGLSMDVRNSKGKKLFTRKDFFEKNQEVSVSDLKERIFATILFDEKEKKGDIKLQCKVKVWDKNSDKSIQINTTLYLVDKL